jgi:hypothetical protein
MREAFENPALLREKGRCARETVLTRHGPAMAGQTMKDLLLDAIARLPRLKPGLEEKPEPGDSHRSQAIDLRKQAKTLHQKTRQQIKALRGWNVTEDLRQILLAILEQQKLQIDAQALILAELGKLRQIAGSSDPQALHSLVRSRRLTADLLLNLTDQVLT